MCGEMIRRSDNIMGVTNLIIHLHVSGIFVNKNIMQSYM